MSFARRSIQDTDESQAWIIQYAIGKDDDKMTTRTNKLQRGLNESVGPAIQLIGLDRR